MGRMEGKGRDKRDSYLRASKKRNKERTGEKISKEWDMNIFGFFFCWGGLFGLGWAGWVACISSCIFFQSRG